MYLYEVQIQIAPLGRGGTYPRPHGVPPSIATPVLIALHSFLQVEVGLIDTVNLSTRVPIDGTDPDEDVNNSDGDGDNNEEEDDAYWYRHEVGEDPDTGEEICRLLHHLAASM